MIDVPARVKDALRSGDYKKNYIIKLTDRELKYTSWWPYPYGEVCVVKFASQTDVYNFDNIPVGTITRISLPKPNTFDHLFLTDDNDRTVLYINSTITDFESYGEFEMTQEIKDRTTQFYATHLVAVEDMEGYPYFSVQMVIDNNNLVSESVKFDERMCSDTELKFGLCEGASVEFQYFDFQNIRDRHIGIDLDVQYKNEQNQLAWHTIPMGQFDVKECSRQASTGIIKATAYDKITSQYLDQDARSQIEQIIATGEQGVPNEASIYTILRGLLDDYAIPHSDYSEVQGQMVVDSTSIYGPVYYDVYEDDPPYSPAGDDYFKLWYLTVQYRPVSATSYETNEYYKYEINTPAIWNVFKDVLDREYSIDGTYYPITGPDEYIRRTNPNTGTYEYNFFKYFAEHAFNNPSYDDPKFEGGVVSSGGLDLIISANKDAAVETGSLTNSFLRFKIPFFITAQADPEDWPALIAARDARYNEIVAALGSIKMAKIYKLNTSDIENKRLTIDEFLKITNPVTLRDLQTAVFELDCQYGKLDRVSNLFSGIELNNGALYPRDNLYPSDGLFPMGTSEAGYPSMYSKLWADEGNVRSFRYLIITYKTTETIEGQVQEVEKTLQRTVNANGTDDYNMSDNWLFRNLVWTAADVGDYADAMVTKMQNIRWFPFEMWCAGLPYLEAGDEIEIQMNEGTYKSYVLRRTLNGIQNLQDEMINGTLDIF